MTYSMKLKKLVNEVYNILKTVDYKISREAIKCYIEQQGAEGLDAQTIVYYIKLYNITD